MTEVGTTRCRSLRVRRALAVGWDLAEGHADEPAGLAGRAALAARYFAYALSRDPAAGGWIRRHRLTEHSSSHSFWSPDLRGEDIPEAVSRIGLDSPSRVLDSLVVAQLAQAGTQRANPALTMFRAVDSATWGGSVDGALGDRETLDEVRRSPFPEYLAHCVAHAVTTDAAANAVSRVDRSSWRGGVVTVDQPGRQCRVALQYRLAPEIDDGACGAVLAQVLDGSDGLLFRRLRTETGLAYGTFAVAPDDGRPRTLVIGASLLRERLPSAVETLRRCVDEIDCGVLPARALRLASTRVVDRSLAKLDDPFGALDDRRRYRDGQKSLSSTVDNGPAAVARLAGPSRLDTTCRPAVGYVGTVDDAVTTLLGRLQ